MQLLMLNSTDGPGITSRLECERKEANLISRPMFALRGLDSGQGIKSDLRIASKCAGQTQAIHRNSPPALLYNGKP